MKVIFVGLSCFLLENNAGGKVLLDPYKDTPGHSLGLKFPSDLQADLFFVSHPDDDHSNLSAKMLHKGSDSELFPEIDIKGVLVREFNEDLNVAYSFSLDGIRFIHLADNAHVLTKKQLFEIGNVDVVFISPPKATGKDYHIQNIKLLKPKIVFVSHYVPPNTQNENPNREEVYNSIKVKVLQDWITNLHANEKTVETFTDMFYEGLAMGKQFKNFEQVFDDTLRFNEEDLTETVKIYLFRKCLGE